MNAGKVIAVMQPYIFPYIGYFQLLYASDVFILYDDVDYIKQGWINRNRIWVNGRPQTFTVPLRSASSYRSIRDTEIHTDLYPKWRKKFMRTIAESYGKTRNFDEIFELIHQVFTETPPRYIAEMTEASISATCSYLGISREIHFSSVRHPNTKGLDRTERLINIVQSENGSTYINSFDGQKLYDDADFAVEGIKLRFLKPLLPNTNDEAGVKHYLSILHLLFNESKYDINAKLEQYGLHAATGKKHVHHEDKRKQP